MTLEQNLTNAYGSFRNWTGARALFSQDPWGYRVREFLNGLSGGKTSYEGLPPDVLGKEIDQEFPKSEKTFLELARPSASKISHKALEKAPPEEYGRLVAIIEKDIQEGAKIAQSGDTNAMFDYLLRRLGDKNGSEIYHAKALHNLGSPELARQFEKVLEVEVRKAASKYQTNPDDPKSKFDRDKLKKGLEEYATRIKDQDGEAQFYATLMNYATTTPQKAS